MEGRIRGEYAVRDDALERKRGKEKEKGGVRDGVRKKSRILRSNHGLNKEGLYLQKLIEKENWIWKDAEWKIGK